MDVFTIVQLILTVIGAATVLFRAIAPLTKNKKDDKILMALESILASIALNKSDKEPQLVVKLKR